MRHMRSSATAFCLLLATSALAVPALAQEASVIPFPVRQFQDENGVDLFSGNFTALTPAVRIGSADMGLTYVREVRRNLFRDTMLSNIAVSGSTYTVGLGASSEVFTRSGSTFTPVENNGSTLTLSGSTYTYTLADGTVATFDGGGPNYFFGNARGIVVTAVAYPSGRTLTYHYRDDSYTDARGNTRFGRRLQGVTTNAGYLMHFTYASDNASVSFGAGWATMTQVKGLNSAIDGCSPIAFTCAVSGRPVLTIAAPPGGVHDYTDAEGRTTRYTLTSGGVTGIRYPGSASDNVSVTFTSGKATSVTNRGVTTGYAYADANGVRTVTVTRPGGATRTVTFDIAKLLMLSDTNETGDTTAYQYDSNNRLKRVTLPEGNYTELTYDGRGNVTQTLRRDKAGTSANDIISAASYPATCTNSRTCNLPTSTTDPRGNVTNYTYDSTHGGVLTVTAPAPTSGATRPQTRISYTRLNASGSPSASGIIVPTGTSACQTGSAPACVGTTDEVKSTISYGYGLQPASASSGAGDNSLTATRAMTYDAVGNLLTVDGPLTGTADTTRYRYNQNRELVGTVGPDPDGAGTLKHRAVRTTYGSTGLVSKTELGTVNSQSDPDWAAFAPLQEVAQDYDSNRRPNVTRLRAGGTTYALTQTNYDTRGRPNCTAVRMNMAQFGSPPASACTLGTQGSDGPDRITQTVYDAASRPLQLKVAVGSSDAATERTLTYTDNGMLATLKDGEDNLTSYFYDGHDRLAETRFPSPTVKNTSNPNDNELLAYDAASNVTGLTTRADQAIAFTYDALNRQTKKDLPPGELDVTYGYDLLGRLASASQTGIPLSFAYDALGRNLTQTGPLGTVTSQWDLAGRRIRITYPDSQYWNLTRDTLGRLTAVKESDNDVLAAFTYDSLGRRTGIARFNGTGASSAFAYDPVSRLSQLTQSAYGTTHDLTLEFDYNPASQIVETKRSNDLYAFTSYSDSATSSTINGLNQITANGGTAFAYDGSGNLIDDGPTSYTYDSQNRLVSATAGGQTTALTYDPLGRLWRVVKGTSDTRFLYDGLAAVGEYNGAGTLLRRYVHSDALDEPLLIYEGGQRKYLHADERGSIIAMSNDSAAVTQVNRYDEFGIPAATNAGTFQYTGQKWIADLGLYDYKARMYAPRLGRFMQPDPIGYLDGTNVYSYVQNEPLSLVDPTGTSGIWSCNDAGICRWIEDIVVTPDPDGCSAGWTCYSPGIEDSFNAPGIPNLQFSGGDLSGTQEARLGLVKQFTKWLLTKLTPKALPKISPKISRQMAARGWTPSKVRQALDRGPVGRSINKANGNTATVYGSRNGYIVVDDATNEIVQVSRMGDPTWVPDSLITWF